MVISILYLNFNEHSKNAVINLGIAVLIAYNFNFKPKPFQRNQHQFGKNLTKVLRMADPQAAHLEHDRKGFFRMQEVATYLRCDKKDLWRYTGFDKAHGKQRYETR